MDELKQKLRLADQIGLAGHIARRIDIGFRLRSLRPLFRDGQVAFQFAHAGEILIELLAVAGSQTALHPLGIVTDGIEDASTVSQSPHLSLDFVRTAVEEQFGKQSRRRRLSRNHRAGACPRQAGTLVRQREARVSPPIFSGRPLIQ